MGRESDEKKDSSSSLEEDKKVGAEILNSIVKKKILEFVEKIQNDRDK